MDLKSEHMKPPDSRDWEHIEEGFRTKWNFPNCCGALDGKHANIQVPKNCGSLFFNYKGTFSLVLMALVDADYQFIYVDIGDYGSQSDEAVFKNSNLGKTFVNGELDIPQPKELPNYPEGGLIPYCWVADEAFPCRMDLMWPYPRGTRGVRLPLDQKIFNYRLSRACRIVENAFDILVQRWQIFFNRRLQLLPENVDHVIKACCVLHNYLEEAKDLPAINHRLNPDGIPYLREDGAILDVQNLHGYHTAAQAKGIHDIYTGYFNSPQGALDWQARAAVE